MSIGEKVTTGEPRGEDKPKSQLDVSAIVITFNSAEDIEHSINSLEASLAHLDAEVLIVDNASADQTTSISERALQRGSVIANDENLGYARAANIGLRKSKGRFSLIMNDDARLLPGAIDRMIEVLEADDLIAAVGPRIVDSADNPTHSARMHFPGPHEEWLRISEFITRRERTSAYPASDEPIAVKWLIGACILVDTDLIRRLGGFNEEFFLYGEDIDLGKRLSAYGYSSVTVPDATCRHVGEASTSVAFTSDARTSRQIAGRSVYYRLWLPRWLRTLVYARRAFGTSGQPDRMKQFLRLAAWDGPSLRDKRFPSSLDAGP